MSGFFNRLGNAQNASNAASATNMKLQSQQLANAINQLALKKQQVDSQGADLAGRYAATSDPTAPGTAPPPGSIPPGLMQPTGLQGSPQNVPMPGAMPMQGGMPGGAPIGNGPMAPIPQVSASDLQPMPGGGPQVRPGAQPAPPAPAGPQAPPGGANAAAAPQNVPWWRTAAAAMKKDNPDATGEQIMSAIEKLSPNMSLQTKNDFENFKLHIEQTQKQAQLEERERNDTARDRALQQNADTNTTRAASYDKSIDERNQRAMDNLKVKIDALKTKGANANNDPGFRALETQYKQISQDLRAAQALGSKSTPEQTLELNQRLQQLTQRMDAYQTGGPTQPATPALAGAPAPAERVTIYNDKGDPFTVPPDQVEEALRQGYKKAP